MKTLIVSFHLLALAIAVIATPVEIERRCGEYEPLDSNYYSEQYPLYEPEVDALAFPKRGLSFNTVATTKPFAGIAGWAYDWSPHKDGSLPSGVEYVPMLWGTDANHLSGFKDAMDKYLKAKSIKYLLGFNEPDHAQQAHMSPAVAAAEWKKYIQPYAGKVQLVSPAVTNGPAPMGIAWLDNFFKACQGCRVDAVAIHIYDSATNIHYFKNYITAAHQRFNKPIWITEFAGSGTVAQQQSFIKQMTAWLDAQSFVHRYAYFADIEGILVSGGKLTPIGKAYAGQA